MAALTLILWVFLLQQTCHSNGQQGSNTVKGRPHPLDPLNEVEITLTTKIIRDTSTTISPPTQDPLKFLWIALKEPRKSDLLPFFLNNTQVPRDWLPRRSHTFVLDVPQSKVFEVVVNLDEKMVEYWGSREDMITRNLSPEEDNDETEAIARADPGIQERCKRLGYTDMSLVVISSWPIGYVEGQPGGPDLSGRRLSTLFFYGKNHPIDNSNAHPFDFIAIVDILERRIVLIEDLPVQTPEGISVPREESQWDPSQRDPTNFLADFPRVKITQQRPGFTINENEITWQKFNFRVGFNARDGLVIYNVNYNDGGNIRPLFYRMSIADMYIHYADPRRPYYRKQIFNEAEQYSLGFLSTSLDPQVECAGEVRFLDYYLHNQKGEPKKIPRVVCVRELDNGILWKHTHLSGRKAVVRNQRLALTFISTVGQYEYAFDWFFHLDGTIEFKATLTGLLSISLVGLNMSTHGYGSIVFPQINAIYHQHYFTLRLDADIDGEKNTVYLSDSVVGTSDNSHKNPFGTAFRVNKTFLKTAEEGMHNADVQKSRRWIIQNRANKNKYTGEPVAFKLVPWNSPPFLLSQDSPIKKYAAILDYNTWVTPYVENQFYPFGRYMNSIGVPEWVKENPNEELIDRDLVLWSNIGLTHVPRVEDWPIMPQESCGILLQPYNFFLENPSMDVPPAGGTTRY